MRYTNVMGGRARRSTKIEQDPVMATLHHDEVRDRESRFAQKKQEFERQFDKGELPFTYAMVKRSGKLLTNLTWLEIMMHAIKHVRTYNFALNADATDITKVIRAAEEVVPYHSGDFRGPDDLTDAFFDGKVPIYFSTLESLGLRLSPGEREMLKRDVVRAKFEEMHYEL
jgi:hypothetical protein